MNASQFHDDEPKGYLVHQRGTPREIEHATPPEQRGWFIKFTSNLLGWVRRNRIDRDIDRTREAGVRIAEATGDQRAAEAQAKVGEAAEHHAAVEERRANSRKTHAEAHKQEIENFQAIWEAIDQLQEKISVLRQNGGNVLFMEAQLRKYLLQAGVDPEKADLMVSVVSARVEADPPPQLEGGG